MLKLTLAIVFISSSPSPSPNPSQTVPSLQKIPSTEGNGRTFATAEEAMQSGCCSHHGGVCGCGDGRKICCDGVASPTCTC